MKILQRAALALAALALTASAFAEWPERPITIVVPFTAGGSSDIVARTVSQKLTERLGQPIVVDNKPGANGGLAAGYVAKAKPDGYTILVGSIGTYAINPVLYKDLAYEPRRDFDLITVAVRTPNALVATPSFPPNNVKELVEYCKKHPNEVSFASSGTGSSDHLTAALFWQKTGTTGIHVPYKGGAPAISDLIAGHAQVSFQNINAVLNHIRSGKLKALAVTGDKRSAALPDVPTLSEAGVKGADVFSWQGVAAPKGLPKDVKDKLHGAMVKALQDPEVARNLNEQGIEVVGNTP